MGSYENDTGLAVIRLEDEISRPFELAAFGLDLDYGCYGLPTWSQDGVYLLLIGFWQEEGCAAGSGLIVLDYDGNSSKVLPLKYNETNGYLHKPQSFGDQWLWTGELEGQFGTWHFTLAGEVINFYENGTAAYALNRHHNRLPG